jgi:hypothetical protein
MIEGLEKLIDNGTTYVTVETPDGWKCDRVNCNIDWKHVHKSLIHKRNE